MSNLERLSLSIDRALLRQLEKAAKRRNYSNRSEFIRDMIRDHLVEQAWRGGREAIGTITLLYDHRARLLGDKLTSLQHKRHEMILATTHVHLDHHICVETILTRGKPAHIEELAELMRRQKGVLHAALSMSSTGKELA